MAESVYDIIRRPIVSEKSMAQSEKKRYTFEVARTATKPQIAKAVEKAFGVKVAKVNTMNVKGKKKRVGSSPAGYTARWKKAIVTLTDDSKSIELFEGIA